MPAVLAFLLAASAFAAITSGSRSGWRTSADLAEEQKPRVQGTGEPLRRWFFWYVLPFQATAYGTRGPEFLSDEEAFALETQTRSASLGVQLYRFAYIPARGVWAFDNRTAPALLAARPITDESGNVIGAIALPKPITGPWPYPELPTRIHVGGRPFVRARIAMSKPGVVAQYREARETDSRHLYVLADGTYRIDHIDEANPDMGRAAEHFFKDFARPMKRVG